MKDQEQLIAARRNQILDAAAKVFAEKGFHPTTIKDIARTAGIADGTIYNYFENKTALLLGIFDRMRELVQQDMDLSALANGDEGIRTFIKAFLQQPLTALKGDNFELFRIILSEMMVNKELRTIYYERILEPTITLAEVYLQQWAEQHNVKPQNLSLTIRVISGMVLGLMLEHIMGDKTVQAQWESLPDFVADMLLDGIRSDLS